MHTIGSHFRTINDMFDHLFKDFTSFDETLFQTKVFSTSNFPPMDLYIDPETKDLQFTFAVAGYVEENITLSFQDDYFIIELFNGTKEDEKFSQCLYHGIKRGDAKIKYPVPLAKYDRESVEAVLKDGMLKVIIKAKEDIKPKEIAINKQ